MLLVALQVLAAVAPAQNEPDTIRTPKESSAPLDGASTGLSGALKPQLFDTPRAVGSRPRDSSSVVAGDSLGYSSAASLASAETDPGAVHLVRNPAVPPAWPHYGGVHEFGAWSGDSLMTGHLFGDAKDIRFGTADVNYSFLMRQDRRWSLRYSPEATVLATLDQPATASRPRRMRSYGSGLSPVGFRANFFPEKRTQPLLSMNGGFLYFNQRVLSPQGSQFMFTIDFGCGLMFYTGRRQAVTIGYRYQHMSNADTAESNPGTDANTFFVGFSRFRTKGYH